jgi:hypothetical protein
MKQAFDGVMGRDTEGARLYRQMVEDGGTTGGLGLSTRKQIELDLESLQKLNRSNPRKAAQSLLGVIDNINQVVEDTNRLSAYKTALENGMTRKQAARIAKESTVNFNRKGKNTGFVNSLYMFSNAAMQGNVKMLQAMKNPKVATAVTTAVAVPTIAANRWNDTIDPEWRDKVTDFERSKNLIIMLPTEGGEVRFMTIPTSYGILPIKKAVDVSYDTAHGYAKNIEETASEMTSAVLESYNPLGGNDLLSTAMPTIGDTALDIARNKNFFGSSIRKDDKEGTPDYKNYFSSLDKSLTGRASIATTEKLFEVSGGRIDWSPANMKYAIEQSTSGVGKASSRLINTINAIGSGEKIEPNDVFMANRFYKGRDEEKVDQMQFYKNKDDFTAGLRRLDPDSDEYKQKVMEYLLEQPDEEAFEKAANSLYFMGVNNKGISKNRAKLQAQYEYLKSGQNMPGEEGGAQPSTEVFENSDGSVYVPRLNQVYDTKGDADFAIAKKDFMDSDETFREVNGMIFRKSEKGNFRTPVPKEQYESDLRGEKMAILKEKEDFQGWMNEATAEMDYLQKKLENPNVDELDRLKTEKDIATLQKRIDKYQRYGGRFKKGRRGRRGRKGKTKEEQVQEYKSLVDEYLKDLKLRIPKRSRRLSSRAPRMINTNITKVRRT